MVAVQTHGCAPVVRAFDSGASACEPWPSPRTVVAGLRVPRAFGDQEILRAVRESGGTAIAVSDEHALDGARLAGTHAGLAMCPEGGAAVAAARALRADGWIREDEGVLLLNTGSATAYLEVMALDHVTGESEARR
jgi:threonine synthase